MQATVAVIAGNIEVVVYYIIGLGGATTRVIYSDLDFRDAKRNETFQRWLQQARNGGANWPGEHRFEMVMALTLSDYTLFQFCNSKPSGEHSIQKV